MSLPKHSSSLSNSLSYTSGSGWGTGNNNNGNNRNNDNNNSNNNNANTGGGSANRHRQQHHNEHGGMKKGNHSTGGGFHGSGTNTAVSHTASLSSGAAHQHSTGMSGSFASNTGSSGLTGAVSGSHQQFHQQQYHMTIQQQLNQQQQRFMGSDPSAVLLGKAANSGVWGHPSSSVSPVDGVMGGARASSGGGSGDLYSQQQQLAMEYPLPHSTCSLTVNGALSAMSGAPDGSAVVVAGRDVLKIISVDEEGLHEKSNLRVGKINLNYSSVDVCWHPNQNFRQQLVTAATNGAVVIWDLTRDSAQKQEKVIKEHSRTVNRIDINPFDCVSLLSGSQDTSMKIFDLRGGNKSRMTILGKSEAVRDVQWSPLDQFQFAAAFENGSVQIYDTRKGGACLTKLTSHHGPAFSVDWHPDSKNLIATGGRDKMIKVWRINGKPKIESSIQTIASVSRIKWKPGSATQIASCSLLVDMNIHLWDTRSPFIPSVTFKEHRDVPTGLLWHNKRPNYIFSCSKDSSLFLHRSEDAKNPMEDVNTIASSFSFTGDISLTDNMDFKIYHEELRPFSRTVHKTGREREDLSRFAIRAGLRGQALNQSQVESPFNVDMDNSDIFQRLAEKNDVLLFESVKELSGGVNAGNILFDSEAFSFLAQNYAIKRKLHSSVNLSELGMDKLPVSLEALTIPEMCEINALFAAKVKRFDVSQTWKIMKQLFKMVYNSKYAFSQHKFKGIRYRAYGDGGEEDEIPLPIFDGFNRVIGPDLSGGGQKHIYGTQGNEAGGLTKGGGNMFQASLADNFSGAIPIPRPNGGVAQKGPEGARDDKESFSFGDYNVSRADEKENGFSRTKSDGFSSIKARRKSSDLYGDGTTLWGMDLETDMPTEMGVIDEDVWTLDAEVFDPVSPMSSRSGSPVATSGIASERPGSSVFETNHTVASTSKSTKVSANSNHFPPPASQAELHPRWQFRSIVKSMILHYAEQGDVQTCISLLLVFHVQKHTDNTEAKNTTETFGKRGLYSPEESFNSGGDGNSLIAKRTHLTHSDGQSQHMGMVGGSHSSLVSAKPNLPNTSSTTRQYISGIEATPLDQAKSGGPLSTSKNESMDEDILRELMPEFDEFFLKEVFSSYIELLQRLKLFCVSNEIIQMCWLPEINAMNQESTTFHTGCDKCLKPLNVVGYCCTRCNTFVNGCSVCHQVVRGLYSWCQTCGHGGHVEHMKKWFSENKYCPTGCGHKCEFS
eukprot:Nk52_evm11s292 gene=Nk52_evmTU11s292